LRASVNYHLPLLLWLKKLLLRGIFKMLKITLPPSQPSPRGEGVKKKPFPQGEIRKAVGVDES